MPFTKSARLFDGIGNHLYPWQHIESVGPISGVELYEFALSITLIDIFDGQPRPLNNLFTRLSLAWAHHCGGILQRKRFEAMFNMVPNQQQTPQPLANDVGHFTKRLRSSVSAATNSKYNFNFQISDANFLLIKERINKASSSSMISKLFQKQDIVLLGSASLHHASIKNNVLKTVLQAPNMLKDWCLTQEEEHDLMVYIKTGGVAGINNTKVKKFAEDMRGALTPGYVDGEYEDDYVHRIVYKLFDRFLFGVLKAEFSGIVVAGNTMRVGRRAINKAEMRKADLGVKQLAGLTALLIVEIKKIDFVPKKEKEDDLEKLAGAIKDSFLQVKGKMPIFGVQVFGEVFDFYYMNKCEDTHYRLVEVGSCVVPRDNNNRGSLLNVYSTFKSFSGLVVDGFNLGFK